MINNIINRMKKFCNPIFEKVIPIKYEKFFKDYLFGIILEDKRFSVFGLKRKGLKNPNEVYKMLKEYIPWSKIFYSLQKKLDLKEDNCLMLCPKCSMKLDISKKKTTRKPRKLNENQLELF